MNRDYSSITPSAKLLLLLKGMTEIPFARQTAEMVTYPEPYMPDPSTKDTATLTRLLHFENRYWSIDQLLEGLGITNILELSSGFSLRGLAQAIDSPIHYIDTDLPDMAAQKKDLTAAVQGHRELKGVLETLPLNALDEAAFDDVVSHFPAGEIAIVNEGLLMYLGMAEKEQLCRTIHRILKVRGGCWITADIYINAKNADPLMRTSAWQKEFFEQHNIEDNKFTSFDEATEFFNRMGFAVDEEAIADYTRLDALKYLMQNATSEELQRLSNAGKMHATWRLRAV